MKKIQSVAALDGYRLLLVYPENEERILDMNKYLDHGIFSELKDLTIFNSVRVSFDSIEWSNGADLDPEVLYRDSVLAQKVVK